jgi:hypothetical protein
MTLGWMSRRKWPDRSKLRNSGTLGLNPLPPVAVGVDDVDTGSRYVADQVLLRARRDKDSLLGVHHKTPIVE